MHCFFTHFKYCWLFDITLWDSLPISASTGVCCCSRLCWYISIQAHCWGGVGETQSYVLLTFRDTNGH
jgi:hypothetical protein